MPASFERRGVTFDGKPVMLYVDAPPKLAPAFLARCHGATMSAQEEGLSEEAYVARLIQTAKDMGLEAKLRRLDDREIVVDVTVPRSR